MMTTLLHRHPEQYLHQCFVMSDSYIAWLKQFCGSTRSTPPQAQLCGSTHSAPPQMQLCGSTHSAPPQNATLCVALYTLRSATNATLCMALYTLRSATNATLWLNTLRSATNATWGGGMMTTLLHRHPEQYPHESRLKRYLQHFRDVGPSYIAWLNTLRFATGATLWLSTLRSATIATSQGISCEWSHQLYFSNRSQPHTSAHTCSSGIYPLVAEPVVVFFQDKLFPEPLQKLCLNVWKISKIVEKYAQSRRFSHSLSELSKPFALFPTHLSTLPKNTLFIKPTKHMASYGSRNQVFRPLRTWSIFESLNCLGGRLLKKSV